PPRSRTGCEGGARVGGVRRPPAGAGGGSHGAAARRPAGRTAAVVSPRMPGVLERGGSVSITYQLNSGNISLKPALPARSVLLKLEKLPSRNRMLVDTSESPGSVSCETPSRFVSKNVRV